MNTFRLTLIWEFTYGNLTETLRKHVDSRHTKHHNCILLRPACRPHRKYDGTNSLSFEEREPTEYKANPLQHFRVPVYRFLLPNF
ncbi:hypothetical protein BWQ96_06620 [Gracilariopsis chorda]|uniref:Uncharacterized protein n=1 Tax=Gracilariopsis chorda TaxID=448386 RepID=A0A2V3INF3_9FLOR|nr:hypothetical protein BWQ96_06620 [Gracilariopsis chorda]|eukprot:PXF43611.1 hypothetical protein BWQ96_06620 [Gracilariopsis chorda]